MTSSTRALLLAVACVLTLPLDGVRVDTAQLDSGTDVDAQPKYLTSLVQVARAPTEALPEGCRYEEDVGFQVGDSVRVFQPDTKAHNTVHEVWCAPAADSSNTGRICLRQGSTESGCYLPEQLRRLSVLDIALVHLQNQAGRVAGALHGQAAKYWPILKEKLSTFADTTSKKLSQVGNDFLAAVNVCDPAVRQRVATLVGEIESRASQVAASVADRWPEVKQGLGSFADATGNQIVALGATLSASAKSASEREQVQKLMNDLNRRFSEVKAAAIDNNPPVSNFLHSCSDFSDRLGELSAKAQAAAVDTYQKESVQKAIATIQASTGQLQAAAAERWPAVRESLGQFAAASGDKIAELGQQAFDAVNLCNPEKRAQLQAAFDAAQARVGQLSAAVAAQVPVVQEGLQEFANGISSTVSTLRAQLHTAVKDASEREDVQAALAKLQKQAAQLQTMAASKSAEMQTQAKALAEKMRGEIGKLMLRTTGGESSTLSDGNEDEAGEKVQEVKKPWWARLTDAFKKNEDDEMDEDEKWDAMNSVW